MTIMPMEDYFIGSKWINLSHEKETQPFITHECNFRPNEIIWALGWFYILLVEMLLALCFVSKSSLDQNSSANKFIGTDHSWQVERPKINNIISCKIICLICIMHFIVKPACSVLRYQKRENAVAVKCCGNAKVGTQPRGKIHCANHR